MSKYLVIILFLVCSCMDVNKDGLKDAVFTFPIKTAVAFTVPDVDTELYLWTKVGKKQLAGYDIVKIKK